jgi:hypothetical protein
MSMQCNYIQTDKISKRKERHTDLVRFNAIIILINEREIGVISVTYGWYVFIFIDI